MTSPARYAALVAMLQRVEFGNNDPLGGACPLCGGLQQRGELGPDRGHWEGCELRALLDECEDPLDPDAEPGLAVVLAVVRLWPGEPR